MPLAVEICQETIIASIVQLLAIGAGILWFGFLTRVLEHSRHLIYFSVGWIFMGIMYSIQLFKCFFVNASMGSDVAIDGLSIAFDSILSYLSSAALIMAWYLMRDLRYAAMQRRGIANPTMSKEFLAKIGSVLGLVLCGSIIILKFVSLNTSQFIFTAIDVIAAAIAGFLIGWEIWRAQYLHVQKNSQLFNQAVFYQMRLWGLIVFGAWGGAQLLHFLSLDEFEFLHKHFFNYPSGGYYTFLAVMKVLCAVSIGLITLHILPEKLRFRHGVGKTLSDEG